MPYVAGVDGGATKTRVALADPEGNVRGVGVAGPSNYGTAPLRVVRENIQSAFQQAWQEAGDPMGKVRAAFLGMANVVSETDRATIYQLVEELDLVTDNLIHVDHDIRISLAGGLGGQQGIALIVGTGSSCYGRRDDGREWMAGGWGHILDDLGSGYDLARKAMIAVVRAEDGRSHPTRLTAVMKEALRIEEVKDIMRRVYYEGFSGEGHPMTKEEIASLAPVVIQMAGEEERAAMQIVEQGVQELVLMVSTVAKQLEFPDDEVPVVVTGGLARKSRLMRDLLYAKISQSLPGSKICEPKLSPVLGGVLLALQLSGIPTENQIVDNLSETGRQV